MSVTVHTSSLSEQMREGSQAEHREAETSVFMAALLGGEVDETGYADYLSQFRPVYEALERVGRQLADHPVAGAVVDPRLERLAAIDADLTFWRGRAGGRTVAPVGDAVAAYVRRIEATLHAPELHLAHHYTRYLGDLSGGQAIGVLLSRFFGLDGTEGVAFYRFDEVPKPKPYKDAYRDRLDALDLDDATRQRVVDEVRATFALNGAIFAHLGNHLDAYRSRRP